MEDIAHSKQDIISANVYGRLRWTTIDVVVPDDPTKEPTTYPTSGQTRSQSYDIGQNICHVGQLAVLLKRLPKPMYGHMADVVRRARGNYFIDGHRDYEDIDRKVFVDLIDKTMWIVVEEPKPLDEFYKSLVSGELVNGKWDGYEIDTKPSHGLVPLFDLKHTLVSWWCE